MTAFPKIICFKKSGKLNRNGRMELSQLTQSDTIRLILITSFALTNTNKWDFVS